MSTKTIKISTNPGNPVALKPVIAASLVGIQVALEQVDVSPEGRQRCRLPVLVADENTRLFDANVMITYILDIAGVSRPRDELLNLLNFEAHTLFPLVLFYLTEKGEAEFGVGKELFNTLTDLEKTLQEKSFFSGESPNFEDVVLWTTLYPLFGSKDKLTTKFNRLLRWFESVQISDKVSAALKIVKPLVGREAAKIIAMCNPSASCTLHEDKLKIEYKRKGEDGDVEERASVSQEDIKVAKDYWSRPPPANSVKSQRAGQVLPLAGQKNYFITSALPYVNNVPHLGNIIGCVLSADVFARYCRVRGRNTLYICGTDEYGTATETKAIEEKLTPQQICDKYHKLHKEIYDWFDISFDYFGRTTTKAQTEIGQDIFLKLWNNGYLKEMVVQQLFCNPCKRFLSDRFVEGTCPSCAYEDARGDQCDKCGRLTNSIELKNPRCKVCGSLDVSTKNSDQVFLDLPKLEEEVGLEQWLNRSSEDWTTNSRHIAKSWIREGLKERCITRDLKWGTPVPIDKYKEKVFYVWFDAPIGYISMTKCYTDNWKAWWMNPDPEIDIEYYQFMAKDNVPFHAILFPASLKGTKDPWTLVRHIMATEYLNYEDGKFSKSRGVGVFGNDAIQTGIPADIWRFYLIFMRPESQDSAFSWDDFMLKNNSELLNNLGNFINRSLTFLAKFFESKIPPMKLTQDDFRIVAEINKEVEDYVSLLESCKLREGLRKILAVSKIGNGYFQAQQPWTLNKNEADLERCGTICGLGAQIVFLLMTLMEPFMPGVSRQVREQLNVPKPIFSKQLLPFLTPGHQIGKVSPLFLKLETELMNSLRKKYAGQQQPIVSVESPANRSGGDAKASADTPSSSTVSVPSNGVASAQDIAELESAIAKQGNIVRDLKAAKVGKSDLQPQLDRLLQLKAELSLKQGIDPNAKNAAASKPKGKPGKKK